MEQGVYIFDNENDFIDFFNEFEKYYKNKDDMMEADGILEIGKPLYSMEQIRKEIAILNRCSIVNFTTYFGSRIIKVNVEQNGSKYLVTYVFQGSLYLYNNFRDYLKKREIDNELKYNTVIL